LYTPSLRSTGRLLCGWRKMVGKTYANAMRSRKGFSFYLEINLNILLCQATQVNKEKKYPVLLF